MREVKFICDWCKNSSQNEKTIRTIQVQDLGCHNKIIDEICTPCEKKIQELKKSIKADSV